MLRIAIFSYCLGCISAFLMHGSIFLRPYDRSTREKCCSSRLFNDIQRDLEEKSRRNAQGGAGETVAGAVLGGLLLGPFGALFGASVASNIGTSNAINKARKDEMERLGITQDMLDMAQECGAALERSMEGLQAVQNSYKTLSSLAKKLDNEAKELYEKATKAVVEEQNEGKARDLLFKRTQTQEKLKDILIQCTDAKQRLETMEDNVKILDTRAKEVESLLTRTVGAKATMDLSMAGSLSLTDEDPLLQKFRDKVKVRYIMVNVATSTVKVP